MHLKGRRKLTMVAKTYEWLIQSPLVNLALFRKGHSCISLGSQSQPLWATGFSISLPANWSVCLYFGYLEGPITCIVSFIVGWFRIWFVLDLIYHLILSWSQLGLNYTFDSSSTWKHNTEFTGLFPPLEHVFLVFI